MQSTPVDKFYVPRWQEHLYEKKICLGTKCQSHTHIKIVLDLLWQPAASRKRPLELPFKPRNDREKKESLHFPSLGQVWTQLHRGVTCWSILLQGTASTSTSTSCLFPHFELLVRSSISTKVFAHFKRAEMKGSLFGFQRSKTSRRTCEFSLWKGKVFPHPGIFSFKIRKIERKVFNPICPSLF